MSLLLGIDIGTSSVKALLFDPDSVGIVAVAQREYPISKPAPDRAEQNPDDWWNATVEIVRAVTERAGRRDIIALGLCGQMHGTVMLDANHQSLAPAIVWPDQRSAAEVTALVNRMGAQRYTSIAGTMPATGFMAVTLPWLRQHDPALFEQIRQVILPKDYVRLKLTGKVATDPSDAAATGLFDVTTSTWSDEIIDAVSLPRAIFPPLLESQALAGDLSAEAAQTLGLAAGIPIVVGCADQPAQTLGNGLSGTGKAIIAISSGGQVVTPFVPKDGAQIPTDPRLHVFNHAIPGMWYILGATLSAGLSLRWLRGVMGMADLGKAAYERFSAEAAAVAPGAEGLIFLPYLSGERTPYMDPHARGGFIGLSSFHEQGHLARAVMEGVAFGLRQALELSIELGGEVEAVIATGGGSESTVWRQILADVLGLPLQKSLLAEQAALGAAMLAGVGVGIYSNFEEAAAQSAQYGEVTEPIREHTALYNALYEEFKALYPRLREDFHTLSNIGR
ncbi:MAG: xylulokinase [Chloroflexi bacterium]|nr:xylulokinase [Chloroflexota bacterium]